VTNHHHHVAVIGAGPGGLCLGTKLQEAGIDDFVLFERADGVGGTWRHNTYPGAACDVPSHLYSFSFAPKYDWSRPYATQPEILEYFEDFATARGLRPHVRLNVEVAAASWDDATSTWQLDTTDGPHSADVLVGAVGMFTELTWPQIPGLDEFAGTLFHSARWRHDHRLAGRTVAVIGTGASAVQLIPEVAREVGQLHVFQRQPQWVLPKADDPHSEEQLARFRADPDEAAREREAIFHRTDASLTFSDATMRAEAEKAGLANLATVEDPEVRRRLAPVGPFGCHRPLISNAYYPTFNRNNVELVTDPIARIAREGVVTADGVMREVDTIVCATGFGTTKFLSVVDIKGREGEHLDDVWADGAFAYLGIAVPGFPNLFMLYGPNTNNGSILHMIECQVGYVVRQLVRMREDALAEIEVSADATTQYNDELQRALDSVEVWHGDCHTYFRSPTGRIVTQWPAGMTDYAARTSVPDVDAFVVTLRVEAPAPATP